MDYLLDTNILIIYIRANLQTQRLEAELNLLHKANNLVISAVTVGEIKSLAIQNKWGVRRIQKLEQLISRFLIADINVEEIINRYAEIDSYSQGKLPGKKSEFTSRNMGKNDLWIAATASILNLTLLTTDSDFDHLNGEFLSVKKVNLKEYLLGT